MWGRRRAPQDPAQGGSQPARQAKKAPGSGGGIKGDKVVDPKGRVIKDLAGRRLREGNEHGV